MIDRSNNKQDEEQQKLNHNKFKISNLFGFFYNNKKILIIVGVLLLISIILIIVNKNIKKESVNSKDGLTIRLLGESTITVYTNEDFLDPGYVATDRKDGDLTKKVQIIGILDINTPGKYDRFYVVENSRGTIVEVKRTIIVKEKNKNNNKLSFNFSLKGSTEIELQKGTIFSEPGFVANDNNGISLINKVRVSSNLDTDKVGTYQITYTLSVNDVTKTLTRKIKVVDKKVDNETPTQVSADVSVNNTNLTSGSIRITLNITGTDYAYTILPSGYKSYFTTINYTVSNNGTYVFNIYDKNGNVKVVEKIITNIDNTKPIVSCNGEIVDKYTNIKITANDTLSGISHYIIKTGSSSFQTTNTTYTLNATKDVTVYAYDNTGNYSYTKCNISGNLPTKVSGNLEVHMFMMGDGDAIVIRSPSYVILVDGGYSGDRGKKFVNYVKALGITKVDAYIGTHYDGDHIGASRQIFANFNIVKSYLPGSLEPKGGNENLDPFRNHSTEVRPDQILNFGNEMTVKIVGPISRSSECKNKGYCSNSDSINFILTYGKTKFFFTGDYVQSDNIIKRYGKEELSNFDFLKQPHHGLHDYISKKLLNYMKPKYVFVPDGRDHMSSNMKSWLKEVGAKVYHTCAKDNQTMVAVSDGTSLKIYRNVKAGDFKR